MQNAGAGRAGFSLLELLIGMLVIAILTVLSSQVLARAIRAAEVADSTAHLRKIGGAVLQYAADHDQVLPGPLWPGQIMLYDEGRAGRIVRDLADYLGIERKSPPFLVESMIPRAYRRAVPVTRLRDARIYVMNGSATLAGEKVELFGSLTSATPAAPARLVRILPLPGEEDWIASEADQRHPDVIAAPWRADTPAEPVHGDRRARVRFDGSVAWEDTAR